MQRDAMSDLFILPESDDIYSDDEGSQGANEHSKWSLQDHDSSGDGQAKSPESLESPGSDVHMAHSEDSFIGVFHMILCCMLSI